MVEILEREEGRSRGKGFGNFSRAMKLSETPMSGKQQRVTSTARGQQPFRGGERGDEASGRGSKKLVSPQTMLQHGKRGSSEKELEIAEARRKRKKIGNRKGTRDQNQNTWGRKARKRYIRGIFRGRKALRVRENSLLEHFTDNEGSEVWRRTFRR